MDMLYRSAALCVGCCLESVFGRLDLAPAIKKDPGEYLGFSCLRGKQTGSGIVWMFSAERSVRQLHK